MESSMKMTYFVDVLLPLPVAALFTYRVPLEMEPMMAFGKRVIVPFGRGKLYAALIVRVHTDPPQAVAKYVLDVVDARPVISEKQYALWQWIADYYLCTLGEVMACALPSALKLASETKIKLRADYNGDLSILNPYELQIVEALAHRETMTVDEVAKLVQVQKIMSIIKSLVDKKVILTDEEIRNPYIPKKETYIRLSDAYSSEKSFMALLDELGSSTRTAPQSDALLAFMMQTREGNQYDFKKVISKSQLLKVEAVSPARWQTLIKKGYLVAEERTISRLTDENSRDIPANILLSPAQQQAFESIHEQFAQHPVTLLHGVTGSGKTEIYIKLIDEVLQQGKQVLYLLPEIALTSQIVNRLRKYFGEKVGIYHSRFSEYERVEIWSRVLEQELTTGKSMYQLILGARSALLLPYQNLGLIIVDEEHDASYKQQDPAPRYHARDSAIMLGHIHNAQVLLGTATPSLESYYNVEQGKYGLVNLMQRFADSRLPDIWTVNMSEAHKQHKVHGVFSDFLIEKIDEALAKKEQIILFQNRRGYAVRMICHTCETMPTCKYCDVTLTYHKATNLLKCHYCGYAIEVPQTCPTCHSTDISMKGFGTEKIEEVLTELFPEARVARMDLDTTRSKNAYQRIITDFEQHKTDILVGTQMVTKGLDFDRVSVVGILNADALLSFPDFRAFERAFQLLSQVSGRAGRKGLDGKVIIQTYQPKHPALRYVETNDFQAMYRSQIQERREFLFPPVVRIIKLSLKHTDDQVVTAAAAHLAGMLRAAFPKRVLGPEYPLVARIQNYFIQDFWIKFPKDKLLAQYKQQLQAVIQDFRQEKAYKQVRCVINVDA